MLKELHFALKLTTHYYIIIQILVVSLHYYNLK